MKKESNKPTEYASIPCQFAGCLYPATHCWISTDSGRAFVGCDRHLPEGRFFSSRVWVKGVLTAEGNRYATAEYRQGLLDTAG